MKILIAPDSFKNALPSLDVAQCIKKGLQTNPNLDVTIQQLSDGGEGAMEVILEDLNFKKTTVKVSNPIGKNVNASYAINISEKSAFIETAQAAGLELLTNNQQNPLLTSTFGVGELILHAYEKGIRNFTLSLGGSATNDGGAGILSALGIDFIGTENKFISNSSLNNISQINIENLKIQNCKFKILVDVENPLLGKNGATTIYAPQKGAKPKDLDILENNLIHFSKLVSGFTNTNYTNNKGSGAAGGIAFGLKSFFDVEVVSGISEIMKFCSLEQQIKKSDLVISGEGSIDSQSQNGKLLSGIAEMCYRYKKPFILVAGKVEDVDVKYFFGKGCKAIIPIQEKSQTLDESIKRTGEMLENTGVNIADVLLFEAH